MPEIFNGGKIFLKLDEKLHPGDYLVSPDRKSKAVLQEDGNFVVRDLCSLTQQVVKRLAFAMFKDC
jgi:hypothetical protein